MAVMKRLDCHIEEFSCQDGRVYNLMKWIINEHIRGKYTIEELPGEAQICLRLWEDEMKFEQEADAYAKEWEQKHRQDVHNKINWAVKNGQLDYDTAMQLINDPAKADEWVSKGVL